jgi:hypothetical protein
VFKANEALETQLRRPSCESRDRNAIVEHVVHPTQIDGLRRDPELGGEKLLVVAVARPQHHAVLAERDWLLVPVGRDVAHGDDEHRPCLLRVCGPGRRGLGGIAEKGGRELAGDGDQLPLHQIEEFVKTLA